MGNTIHKDIDQDFSAAPQMAKQVNLQVQEERAAIAEQKNLLKNYRVQLKEKLSPISKEDKDALPSDPREYSKDFPERNEETPGTSPDKPAQALDTIQQALETKKQERIQELLILWRDPEIAETLARIELRLQQEIQDAPSDPNPRASAMWKVLKRFKRKEDKALLKQKNI